jgi:hypothetical protein
MLTGKDEYLDPWRRQIDKINEQAKKIDGRNMFPRMYGDRGWYNFVPEKYDYNAVEIYYLSMRPADLKRVLQDETKTASKSEASYRDNVQNSRDLGWLRYLQGDNPGYPEMALRSDLDQIRTRVRDMRADTSTPDTRLSDDPMGYNPARVSSLVQLMLGGLHPGRQGNVLQCRLRYFDPVARRAGIPDDVAALVDQLTESEVCVTLINLNQLATRTMLVQAGGYGEHQFVSAELGGNTIPLTGAVFEVKLSPGSGARLKIQMQRFKQQPTMLFPWDRS